MTIKVLVIDDSPMIRKIFTQELSKDPEIEVVGTAPDPIIGRDKIIELRPDVITLNIEMPKMDGLTFLEKLMKHYPIPVIVVSSIPQKSADIAIRALELGALDVVVKPSNTYSASEMTEQLIQKIKAASKVKVFTKTYEKSLTNAVADMKVATTNKIIAIGASTGGIEALKEILTKMPVNCPPIVIVQHMPHNFTKAFADRINELCKINVKEAEDGEYLSKGTALIAPGNKHMEIRKSGSKYFVSLLDTPMVFHQRPSVEILFNSVAKYAGKNAVGAILTGMGKDGAQGLLNMKNAGAKTVAQDEKTSVVFGMPKEAIELGAADMIKPLNEITQTLLGLCD